MKSKFTYWHRIDGGVSSITKKRVKKVVSTTQMVYGILAKLIFDHCKSYPDGEMIGREQRRQRKITVTITG